MTVTVFILSLKHQDLKFGCCQERGTRNLGIWTRWLPGAGGGGERQPWKDLASFSAGVSFMDSDDIIYHVCQLFLSWLSCFTHINLCNPQNKPGSYVSLSVSYEEHVVSRRLMDFPRSYHWEMTEPRSTLGSEFNSSHTSTLGPRHVLLAVVDGSVKKRGTISEHCSSSQSCWGLVFPGTKGNRVQEVSMVPKVLTCDSDSVSLYQVQWE